MNKLDSALLNLLIKDGRASFADIARQLGISRAHARTRVQALVSSGVIELFSAVVNPEKLGKVISTFVDLRVTPVALEPLSQELADCPEVVSLYIMSDLQSLHVHTLTDSYESFDAFVRKHLLNRPEILSVRPGITDPGSIEFRHEETELAAAADPERHYVEVILPRKVALYVDYVRTRSLLGDLRIILHTFAAIAR